MGLLRERFRRRIPVPLAPAGRWGVFLLASPEAFRDGRIDNPFLSTIPVTLGMPLLVALGESDLSFPAVSAAAAYVFALLVAREGGPWRRPSWASSTAF